MTNAYRSLLDPVHDAAGANWQHRGDYRVVADYGETGQERSLALGHLALMDLSALPRFGYKGVGITDWLETQQLRFSLRANRTVKQADGSLLGRLSPNEFLWLAGFDCPTPDPGVDIPGSGRDCYAISRRDSHYWFGLSGTKCAPMLAKLCAVDFASSSFENGSIAQTQLAKTSTIVVRCDLGQIPFYHLLGDSSLVSYMWTCLVDAMGEFSGQKLGLATVESSSRDVR